eukprot:gene10122-10280_t
MGVLCSSYFQSALQIMYWQGLWKYAVQGWLAVMLMLPLRTQLAVSFTEWVMLYAAGVQVERLIHGWDSYLSLYHCISNFLLIMVLPTAGVWLTEGSLKAQYNDLAAAGSSMAQCVPASVKVHANHSNVALLSPLLASCVASQLGQFSAPGAGSSALPAYMQAACFAGCVQLLANIFMVKKTAAIVDDCSSRNSSHSGKLHGSVEEAAAYATAGATVAVAAPGQYKLLSCEPACLVAGRQQQLKLHVCPAGQQQEGRQLLGIAIGGGVGSADDVQDDVAAGQAVGRAAFGCAIAAAN